MQVSTVASAPRRYNFVSLVPHTDFPPALNENISHSWDLENTEKTERIIGDSGKPQQNQGVYGLVWG